MFSHKKASKAPRNSVGVTTRFRKGTSLQVSVPQSPQLQQPIMRKGTTVVLQRKNTKDTMVGMDTDLESPAGVRHSGILTPVSKQPQTATALLKHKSSNVREVSDFKSAVAPPEQDDLRVKTDSKLSKVTGKSPPNLTKKKTIKAGGDEFFDEIKGASCDSMIKFKTIKQMKQS